MGRIPDVCNMILLLGLGVLLWMPRLSGPIDLRYDAGIYYVTGTSLAEGKGYRLVFEPGEVQAIQYPPLLPAFVAVHQWILQTSDPEVVGPWLRRSFFLLFLLYMQAVYGMARGYLAAPEALLVPLISSLYLHSFFMSDFLFAEIPFALLTILFVIGNKRRDQGYSFIVNALLGIAAYLVRTAGIALLAAWVAEGVLQRDWRRVAIRTAVALMPVVAWQAYVHHVESSREYQHPVYPYQRAAYQYHNVSYTNSALQNDAWAPERGRSTLSDLPGRLLVNLTAMPMSFGEAVTSGKGFWEWLLVDIQHRVGLTLLPLWVGAISIFLLGCLCIAGTGLLFAQREWLIPIYIAASAVLMCLTPWPDQFSRYLTPVTPFLALALVRLLAAFRTSCRRRWSAKGRVLGQMVTVLVVSTVLVIELYTVLRSYQLRRAQGRTYATEGQQSDHYLFFYDHTWRAYDAAMAWLKERARPEAIVATVSPEWVYLKTGLTSVMPPMVLRPAEAQQLLDSVPVEYIIVDELRHPYVSRKYADPVIRSYPERWRLIYCVPGTDTRIYQRVATKPDPSRSD